jgi:hypothetical protein
MKEQTLRGWERGPEGKEMRNKLGEGMKAHLLGWSGQDSKIRG